MYFFCPSLGGDIQFDAIWKAQFAWPVELQKTILLQFCPTSGKNRRVRRRRRIGKLGGWAAGASAEATTRLESTERDWDDILRYSQSQLASSDTTFLAQSTPKVRAKNAISAISVSPTFRHNAKLK